MLMVSSKVKKKVINSADRSLDTHSGQSEAR